MQHSARAGDPAVGLAVSCDEAPRRRRLRVGSALCLALVLVACAAPVRDDRRVVYSRSHSDSGSGAYTQGSGAMYFYPQQGQSQMQQSRDRYECYHWAVSQTRTDPGMSPWRSRTVVMAPARPAVPDAVSGAVTGAVVGGVLAPPGRGGEWAAIGMIAGAALGAAADQQRNEAIRDAQEAAAAQAQPPAASGDFRRAMSACMAGRGYTIG